LLVDLYATAYVALVELCIVNMAGIQPRP